MNVVYVRALISFADLHNLRKGKLKPNTTEVEKQDICAYIYRLIAYQFRIKTSKNATFERKLKYVPVDRIQCAIAQNDQ